MIARLIATGTLFYRRLLFWDEPQANLNPKLIREAAKIVNEVSKSGIQGFVATHSLFFMRELEILSAKDVTPVQERNVLLPLLICFAPAMVQ